jgi:hypothetical protein
MAQINNERHNVPDRFLHSRFILPPDKRIHRLQTTGAIDAQSAGKRFWRCLMDHSDVVETFCTPGATLPEGSISGVWTVMEGQDVAILPGTRCNLTTPELEWTHTDNPVERPVGEETNV